jgi:poly(3-hydroxybutyrate) depolymerase
MACLPAASTTAAGTSVDAAAAPLWPDVAVSAVAAWWTTAARVGEHWTGTLARGAAPLDVAADVTRFSDIALRRDPLTCATPNEVGLSTPLALLRSFCEPSGSTLVRKPVVATAVRSLVIDRRLQPGPQSGVRDPQCRSAASTHATGAARRRPPRRRHRGLRRRARRGLDALGGRANLIGDSQGGWLAAIYTALRPGRVNAMTVVGAPIDFHAGRPPIQRMVDLLGMPFVERLLALGGG